MKKQSFSDDILKNEKFKKQISAFQSSVETGAHVDVMTKFHGKQGHGFAAEEANNLIDKLHGELNSEVVGNDFSKNGADRVVNGQKIQTKYCSTAHDSVNAAFKNGKYRYYFDDTPMQLEVPYDQYQEAVELMRKKIIDGEVPGINDPNDAEKFVRRGRVDYKTAKNIAKAGNIDSIMFDSAHGMVIATCAMGISSAIVFAKSIWEGEKAEKALDLAIYDGIKSGGMAFVASVITAQLTRTSLNQALMSPTISLVRLLPAKVRQALVNALRDGAPIYGEAASKNLAKLLRSNIIAAVTVIAVMSTEDIVSFFRGKISGKQLFKNVTTLAASVGGGYAGAAVGGVIGGCIGGTIAPGAGAISGGKIGSAVGGIVGGVITGEGTNKLLSKFIEEDAVEMLKIIEAELIPLTHEYLLSMEELEIVIDDLKIKLEKNKMLEMYAAPDHKTFAQNLLIDIINNVVAFRAKIIIPDNTIIMQELGIVLKLAQDEKAFKEHFDIQEIDKHEVAKKVLGYDVSNGAANMGLYVTKQVDTTFREEESVLIKMKNSEDKYTEQIEADKRDLMEYHVRIDKLIKEEGK